jgi:hypothetical protein
VFDFFKDVVDHFLTLFALQLFLHPAKRDSDDIAVM